jgi:hypothetical protein
MATLSTISIKVDAQTATFGTKLRKAEQTVQGFASRSSAAIGMASKAFIGFFASAVSIGAAVAIFNRSRNAIDELAKSAGRLKIEVGTLQAMRLAMDLTGISAETLGKRMLIMATNVRVAVVEGGKAAEAIAALGLNLDHVSRLPVDQQFAEIADALGRIVDVGEQARLARDIFGKGGMDLMNAFGGVKRGVAEANQLLDEWNAKLTSADAKAVEAMNDSWTKLTTVVSGLVQKFVAQLAPAAQAFLDTALEILKPTEGIADYFENIVQWIEWGGARAADFFSILVGGWRTGKAVSDGYFHTVQLGIASIRKAWLEFWRESTTIVDREIAKLQKLIRRDGDVFTRGMEDIRRGVTGEVGAEFLERVEQNRRAAEESAVRVAGAFDDIADDIADATQKMQDIGPPGAMERGSSAAVSAINRLQRDQDKTLKPLNKMVDHQARTNQLLKDILDANPILRPANI